MCPRCCHLGLHHTGIFWQCSHCRLAITHPALCQERDRSSPSVAPVSRRYDREKEYE